MNTLRRFLTLSSLAGLIGGMASAATVYSTTTFGPTNGNTYSLTLNDFDPTLGTLTGVELYFKATESVTNFTVTNTGAAPQSYDLAVTTNLTNTFVNSANAADVFSGENITIFDTGIGTALGGCKSDPTTTVAIHCAGTQTLAAGTSTQYAPISATNTSPNYSGANNPGFTGITTGTGVGGTFGAALAGTTISDYLGTGHTFTLSGSTLGGTTFSTTGTNNETLTQTTTITYTAEVDYTYTPFTTSTTPEPTTMVLLGC